MSLSIYLDEYDEQRLLDEIRRRRDLRARGLCDYCGRAFSMESCRMARRHKGITVDS